MLSGKAKRKSPVPLTYRRICDGSAAVALDAETFVVANDERDALLFYRYGKPDPFACAEMPDLLGKVKESDLEGAATIGDLIYWISSHGVSGKSREPRARFFATRIETTKSGLRLKKTGKDYTGLVKDLIREKKLTPYDLAGAAKLAADAEGGLNIEGLAAWRNGGLLIGFRSPVRDGKALAVPLENPEKVVKGNRGRFGDPVELDLDGRGIRSLERVGTDYVIVAGPLTKRDSFAVYRWSGRGDKRPKQLKNVDLGDLRPEAVFAVPGSNIVYLLSDDSGVGKRGADCKSREESEKSFRAVKLVLRRTRQSKKAASSSAR